MEVEPLKEGQRGHLAVRRMESANGMRRIVSDGAATLATWADDEFSTETCEKLDAVLTTLDALRATMEDEIREAAYGTEFAKELREHKERDDG